MTKMRGASDWTKLRWEVGDVFAKIPGGLGGLDGLAIFFGKFERFQTATTPPSGGLGKRSEVGKMNACDKITWRTWRTRKRVLKIKELQQELWSATWRTRESQCGGAAGCRTNRRVAPRPKPAARAVPLAIALSSVGFPRSRGGLPGRD
jgi:hypothetical protein